jgi:hypothetical protein
MLRTCTLALLALATPALAQLRATIDPRVEIIAITFRLAGNPEYSTGRLQDYIADVDAHFGPHADHELISLARTLRNTRGVSYDACMSMAVHLDVVDHAFVPRRPLAEAVALDERWPADGAARFVDFLNDFAAESDFWAFYDAHKPLYDLTTERMNAVIDTGFDQPWFDRYYGTPPTGSFELILAPVSGGGSYGPKYIDPDGAEHVYAILGIWNLDDHGDPVFSESSIPGLVHEFGHSFANPQIYAHEADLANAGEAIYPLVEDTMRRQAYGNWRTMFCESLVRAAVSRYVLEHDGDEAAERHTEFEIGRGFLWTRDFSDLLGEYEANRERYPTFDDFMPRVVAFFDEQVPIIEQRLEKQRAAAPHVVRAIPPDGAEGVDPALAAITIAFDRPMKESWSFMLSPDLGREGFPEVAGDPSISDDHRTITLPVRLRPDATYELWLNSASTKGFQSADGASLEPYRIRFTTASD